MKALIISADEFEDSELLVPYYRLREEGFDVDIAAPRQGRIAGKHGYVVEANLALEEVRAEDHALLVVPGGRAPQAVRGTDAAQAIVKSFFQRNLPVAAICHGPQVLITAGVLDGRHATCYKSVAPEMQAAGALYEDSEVVVDGNLVTSRQPADLPAFMRALMRLVRHT